jgi:hypothetical protein
MSPINFNAPWDPLKHVWVGSTYTPAFYEPIKNTQIRDSLQTIAAETEEDYQHLVSVLKSFNITVDRPQIDSALTIMDSVDSTGSINYNQSKSLTLIPRPPMQPRDSMLIVGESMLETNSELSWFDNNIRSLNILEQNLIKNTSHAFDAPLVTVIGRHLIVDCREHPWLAEYVSQIYPDRVVVPIYVGGHNDAVFCTVRPGLIVSTYHHDTYAESFPGWEVYYIENQSWNAIPEWRRLKHSNVAKWWTPDKHNNPEFANFVDTWLTHWLGYVEETVFDVNMLQIDQHTILVNNYNQGMFDFFKKRNIEPIVVPFRHRFFWDGGIHCITADIYRQGDCNEYIRFSR